MDGMKLKKTLEKMLKIIKADTGASEVYRDMLLSLLPNSKHKVNLALWIYKADQDDFETINEFIKASKYSDIAWDYAEALQPFVHELKKLDF